MKPISEVRRARLRELVAEQGSQVAVADRLQKNKNQVYQWLLAPGQEGARNISERSARGIERAFNKPAFWLDSDPSRSGSLPESDRDFRQSPSARLDSSIIEPAVTMARAMVGVELGNEAPFDPYGDIPLFIAAYNLMAERTLESRARFDEAMAARVAAHRGKHGKQRNTDPSSDRRGS